MKILVSGGTGYIGTFLCSRLLEEGHELALISRSDKSSLDTYVYAYSDDIQELKKIFHSWKPDIIVHLAADISKKTTSENISNMIAVNITFPAYLLQLSLEYNVSSFINISTFSTSIDGKNYNPQTFYAATKKATEDLAAYYSLRTNLDVCTLCFYDVYGPNQPHARFLNACLDAINNGVSLHMSPGEQEICFLYVEDAVDAIIHAIKSKNLRTFREIYTYTVMGNEIFQLKEVPIKVAQILKKPCPKIIHDMSYREPEIMHVMPCYPLLSGWTAKVLLEEGISKIMR